MTALIFKFNLTENRYEDNCKYQEMLNEIFPLPIDSTARNRLYICETLLHNDAVRNRNFLYALSKEAIEKREGVII